MKSKTKKKTPKPQNNANIQARNLDIIILISSFFLTPHIHLNTKFYKLYFLNLSNISSLFTATTLVSCLIMSL